MKELTPEQKLERTKHLAAVALAIALRNYEVATIPLFYQLTYNVRNYK